MSRRRGNGPFVAKGAEKITAAKAVGSSDASLLVGTIADANSERIPDVETYWYLYKSHPIIRSCVRMIANSVASEGFSVGLVDGDDTQPLEDGDGTDKQIREFFRGAFAPKSSFRSAMKATTVDLEIYGWAFWLKKRTGKLLTNLERLDPRMYEPKLNDAKTEIKEFAPRKNRLSATGVAIGDSNAAPIPAEDVVMFSLDEGGDVVLGSPSPLEALDLTTSMDLNIRKHRNSFFKNGATVGNVLVNKECREDDFRNAEKAMLSLHVGPGGAYKNLLLAGDWEVKSLMQSGKNDLDFVKATEIVRDEICSVYCVPVSKIVNVAGSMGQAGKGEDDETYNQECVLPIEELIYEKITQEILCKELDVEGYEIVPKRRNAMRYDRIQAAKDLVTCGGTGNEARAIIGLAPIDDDKYDMDAPLFVAHTALTVSDDEPTKQADPKQGDLNQANDKQDDGVAKARAKGKMPY